MDFLQQSLVYFCGFMCGALFLLLIFYVGGVLLTKARERLNDQSNSQ